MSIAPLTPPHPEVVAYRAELEAALQGHPERGPRLAALEAESRAAPSEAEFRAVGVRIVALLDEARDEVDAVRRAEGKPVPWHSGRP